MAFNNFNYGLAFRSQGVTPDMYSDDPEEAKKMMYEDAEARWNKDRSGFQKDMLRQGALERNQGARPAQQQAPRAPKQIAPEAPAMHPQAAAHFGAQNDMIAATNAAIGNEMANRRKLAENERERQHQYQIEAMRQQGANQRAQAQEEPQGGFGGGFQQKNAARQARNRSLLGMAGLGGYTLHIDGKGGRTFTPHAYARSPLARSLLG
jgi:hypothetical protein